VKAPVAKSPPKPKAAKTPFVRVKKGTAEKLVKEKKKTRADVVAE
jgi:hypothetical protein